MTLPDGLRDGLVAAREKLSQSYSVEVFERFHERVLALSVGDRFIAYTLSLLVCFASLTGLYALQRSLLVTVPAYGGTLVEGELGSPRFINPILATSDADRDLTTLTYAGLMGISGSGALIPVLAESYEISPDGKMYTFMLREDVKFSDGVPVTAADVVFTVQKAQNPVIKSPGYANWSGVSVVAVDERTVRFTLARPYVPFLEVTTLGILPARLWQNLSDTDFPFSDLQIHPVGAGPFAIKSVSRDASGLIKSAVLVENSYYPLGRPYLDSIRFKFYSRSEDLAEALKTGGVESAYGVDAPDALSSSYARVFGVFWNQDEKPIYTRAEVREALSLALDREKIISTVLGTHATPIMGPVPPNGITEQVPIPQTGDSLRSAVRVLEKTGWTYDGEARVWTNAKAKVELDTIVLRTSNVPELKNVAAAVKEAWEQLGISVSVELYEQGDLSQNIIRPRKYEALLYGLVIDRDQDLFAFWHSQERNNPGLNIALYANKTVDALLEDARINTDETVRMQDLQKIEDIIAAEYPAAFIYTPHFTYSVPPDLHGIELPQIVTPADRFANVASWYRVTDAVWPFLTSER